MTSHRISARKSGRNRKTAFLHQCTRNRFLPPFSSLKLRPTRVKRNRRTLRIDINLRRKTKLAKRHGSGGAPAAAGELRLGHRAPGRGGRRVSIPLHALTTLLSALGAVGRFEPRSARICLGNSRHICSDNGNASQGADNTSVRARGVLSGGIPRFLNKSQHFTVHLFRPWRPGSARGSDGGPRRFTAVVPTPHAYSGQWPVKTQRARARSCASAVTRKRPSLNRARQTSVGTGNRSIS